MFVLRIVVVLVGFAIAAGILAWLLTGNRKYLTQSWNIARYSLLMVFVLFALMLLERLVAMA